MAAFSGGMLEYGVLAEVYTWQACIHATIFYGLARGLFQSQREKEAATTKRALLLVAGALGVGLAHHLTTSWWFPVLLLLVVLRRKSLPKTVTFWGLACAIFVFGLAGYVILWWRSIQQPFFDYGAVSEGFGPFFSHVFGGMFRYRLGFAGWDGLLANAQNYLESLTSNWPWPFWLGLAPGAVFVVKTSNREAFAALALWWLSGLTFCLLYTVPDPQGYFLSLHLPLGALALFGWWRLGKRLLERRFRHVNQRAAWLLPVACALLVFPQTLRADLSEERSLTDLTRLIWKDCPPGTLLVTQDLSLAFSTLSMQLDGELPKENMVISEYLLPLPWYLDHLRRQYPAMAFPEGFEADLVRNVKKARAVDGRRHGDAMQRIAGEAARVLARKNFDEREVRLYRAENERMPERWGQLYLEDRGLTAQVLPARRSLPPWRCEIPPRYLEPDDRSAGETTVATRLATSCNRLAIHLYEANRNAEALEAVEKALKIDPEYAAAYKNLGVLRLNRFQDEEGARRAWKRYRELSGPRTDAAIRQWLDIHGEKER